MQTPTIAFVCLLTAGCTALAAEPARAPDKRPVSSTSTSATQPPSPPATTNTAAPQPASANKTSTPLAAARPHPADPAAKPRARVCFNAADTRDKIATHRLTEPFRALRAGRLQGEALRARLCRWKNEQFVYEISVLRHDGRIVHVYMNAENGQTVGALSDSDHK